MASGKWNLPAMELTGDEMHVLLAALSALADESHQQNPDIRTTVSDRLYERFKSRRVWVDDRDRKAAR